MKVEAIKIEPCLWITHVNEGSPAETSGLLLGDALLKFEDFTPTKQMSIEEILEQIKVIVQ